MALGRAIMDALTGISALAALFPACCWPAEGGCAALRQKRERYLSISRAMTSCWIWLVPS